MLFTEGYLSSHAEGPIRRELNVGLAWLARSATGDAFSRHHAEAGIAAGHCLAPSFRETRWERIRGAANGIVLLEGPELGGF